MFETLSEQSILGIVSHLFFIAITWWALQALNFEKFLRPNRVFQARLLYILLTIAIASTVSNFFLNYLSLATRNPYFF
ncbi:MAG: DUF1146 family protein [Bacillus sp. (in: firmicutes)]